MTMAFKQLFISVLIIAAQYHPSLGQDAPASTPEPKSDTDPEPQPTPDPPVPKLKCATSGYICSDCDNQALCVGKGDGTFNQVENPCAKGSKCLENICVPGAKCNYRKFKCSSEGFFPDPYDCTKYHVCMQVGKQYQELEFKCGKDRGSYDATSGSCGFALNSTACTEGPVPRCTDPLKVGMLKSDPTIYYICTEDESTIGPELFKCGGGSIFDPKKITCVPSKKK